MATIPIPHTHVNPPPRKPHGFAETDRMELDERGLLYLKEHDPETDDHVCLGHVEDADVPGEFDDEFRHLLSEWREGQKFAHGCEVAVHGAFEQGHCSGRWI